VETPTGHPVGKGQMSELFVEGKCSPTMLDFLRSTGAGKTVPREDVRMKWRIRTGTHRSMDQTPAKVSPYFLFSFSVNNSTTNAPKDAISVLSTICRRHKKLNWGCTLAVDLQAESLHGVWLLDFWISWPRVFYFRQPKYFE